MLEPRLRPQLLALHQISMDAGTMALKIHTFSAAGIKSEGLLASGFSIHLRPQLLALHQISMDAGTMALKMHTFSCWPYIKSPWMVQLAVELRALLAPVLACDSFDWLMIANLCFELVAVAVGLVAIAVDFLNSLMIVCYSRSSTLDR